LPLRVFQDRRSSAAASGCGGGRRFVFKQPASELLCSRPALSGRSYKNTATERRGYNYLTKHSRRKPGGKPSAIYRNNSVFVIGFQDRRPQAERG